MARWPLCENRACGESLFSGDAFGKQKIFRSSKISEFGERPRVAFAKLFIIFVFLSLTKFLRISGDCGDGSPRTRVGVSKFVHRVGSFKDDFFEKISSIRSPGSMSNGSRSSSPKAKSRHRSGSPKRASSPADSCDSGPDNPLKDLECQVKQVRTSYYRPYGVTLSFVSWPKSNLYIVFNRSGEGGTVVGGWGYTFCDWMGGGGRLIFFKHIRELSIIRARRRPFSAILPGRS